MINVDETLWQQIQFATEADLKGLTDLSVEDRNALLENPDLHLAALKIKKNNVEYQFTSNKFIVAKNYQEYRSKKISYEEYEEVRLEQLSWKIKASSYLHRVEQKIQQVKAHVREQQA